MQPISASLKRITNSQVLPRPRFKYTPALSAGNLIFVSGVVGLSNQTGTLVEGGAFEQTLQVLYNLQALCDEQDWKIDRIAMARVYCVGTNAIEEVNRAWNSFFEDREIPARSVVVVIGLPLGAAVEIEFQLFL